MFLVNTLTLSGNLFFFLSFVPFFLFFQFLRLHYLRHRFIYFNTVANYLHALLYLYNRSFVEFNERKIGSSIGCRARIISRIYERTFSSAATRKKSDASKTTPACNSLLASSSTHSAQKYVNTYTRIYVFTYNARRVVTTCR